MKHPKILKHCISYWYQLVNELKSNNRQNLLSVHHYCIDTAWLFHTMIVKTCSTCV